MMEIIYNKKKLWLLKIGDIGKQSNNALCVDEDGNKVKIKLNIDIVGSYTFPSLDINKTQQNQ